MLNDKNKKLKMQFKGNEYYKIIVYLMSINKN